MSRHVAALLLTLAAAALGGCRGTGRPQFFGPGSAPFQQDRAQQFDPYPETEIGPSVEGGRPDGYSAPAPEPARGTINRWTAPLWGR